MDRLLLRLLVLLAVAAAPARATVLLNGAGATFPFPRYSKWFAEFSKRAPDIQINYQPIGSGGGIGERETSARASASGAIQEIPATGSSSVRRAIPPTAFARCDERRVMKI
jgi:ABC-type phosphate transport system substrate-binding protein